jgi:hypothetical protein
MPDKKLAFQLQVLRQEIKVMPALAAGFLAGGTHRSAAAAALIDSAAAHPDRRFVWQIPEAEPLETITSCGEYERRESRSKKRGVPIIGLLSFTWDMITSPKPVEKAYLHGNASTVMRLIRADDRSEISMWRMEIAPPSAPGCCFHTQVLGKGTDPPFPGWIPVPRLPNFPFTPMACLEFLLSELFQHRWSEHVLRKNERTRSWRSFQRDRLASFLAWQQQVVAETNNGSPLVRLKAFPDTQQLEL